METVSPEAMNAGYQLVGSMSLILLIVGGGVVALIKGVTSFASKRSK